MEFLLKLFIPLRCVTLVVVALSVWSCRSAPQDGTLETPKSQVSAAVVTSNATLGSKITSALAKEPKLQGSNVIVSVSNLDGRILLSGNVAQKAQEKLAIEVAKRQAKKSKVVSQLKIQTPKPVSKSKKKAASDECCR